MSVGMSVRLKWCRLNRAGTRSCSVRARHAYWPETGRAGTGITPNRRNGSRREQNEIHWCLVGGCQHVAQAPDVHIHGHVRLGFAMRDDVHRRQMHDCRGLRLPGYLEDIGRICNVRTDEPKEISTQAAGDAIEAMLISIDGDHLVAFNDQGINEHCTDESS